MPPAARDLPSKGIVFCQSCPDTTTPGELSAGELARLPAMSVQIQSLECPGLR